MASSLGRKTRLKKYLAYNGKWQFFPVATVSGKPKSDLVVIGGKPRRSTGGTFYLDGSHTREYRHSRGLIP